MKTRMKAFVCALVATVATGCDQALLVDPAAPPALIGVSFSVANSAMGGPGAAFDKVDSVHVAVFKASDFEGDIEDNFSEDFQPEGALAVVSTGFAPAAETRVQVEIDLQQDLDTLIVVGALARGREPLFLGTAMVVALRGEMTATPVELMPIPARIFIPTVPTITAIGDSEQMGFAVVFATGDTIPGFSFSFVSSNPGVVTVDAAGRLLARSEGQTQLTVSAENDLFALDTTVVVNVQATVISIDITPSPATVDLNTTLQLTARARDRRNNVLNRTFTWTSSAPTIASVELNTGRVTGVAAGPAVITARTGTASGTVNVTVLARPRISLDRSSVQFAARVGDPDPAAQVVNISNPGGGTLTGLTTGAIQYGAGQTGGWLTPSVNNPTTPAVLTLRVTRGSLAPGTYTAVVPVIASNADNSPQNVNVTLVVSQTFVLTVTGQGAGNGVVTSDSINCTVTAGSASGRCSARYTSGSQVTLTAAPASGSSFTGWTNACSGVATTCSLTMSANRDAVAGFNPPGFTLTVTGQGAGNGRVQGGSINCLITAGVASGTCSQFVVSGGQVTLVAVPFNVVLEGYPSAFGGWINGCGTTPTCPITVTANRTVTAQFNLLAAPVISGLRLIGTRTEPLCPAPHTTVYDFAFDFSDLDGNVTSTSTFIWGWTHLPSGFTGDPLTLQGTVTGTAFSGTISFGLCITFGTDTSLATNVRLTDASGLQSNLINLTIQRPAGAPNVPSGVPVASPAKLIAR